jgi:hypothetical protein
MREEIAQALEQGEHHCRTGTWGNPCSTRCAAVSAMRRVLHEGQIRAPAGVGNQDVMRQDPAAEIPTEVPLDEAWDGIPDRFGLPHSRESGLQMLQNQCPAASPRPVERTAAQAMPGASWVGPDAGRRSWPRRPAGRVLARLSTM